LVFFGTKIAELRKHPFPNLFPLSFRIKTVIFSQSGLKAKSMPDKTKIGSVYSQINRKESQIWGADFCSVMYC